MENPFQTNNHDPDQVTKQSAPPSSPSEANENMREPVKASQNGGDQIVDATKTSDHDDFPQPPREPLMSHPLAHPLDPNFNTPPKDESSKAAKRLSLDKSNADNNSPGAMRQSESSERRISRTSTTGSTGRVPNVGDEDDEPLMSGTGEVNRDCTEEDLQGWSQVLEKWHTNLKIRPKSLPALIIRRGMPDPLRAEVWQLMAGCGQDAGRTNLLVDQYRLLVCKECPYDAAIRRDINRTFPAHEYFRRAGSTGQNSLYKICKAYAVYDEEIGYCQGMSFLVAALLLHMPEEQAFAVLVKIMYDYGQRDLFREAFADLHKKFFQLDRLIDDQLPDLYKHFYSQGVEVHMFSSQWFLTIFTAKFPLQVVFPILDYFLLMGIDSIFQVAIALLHLSRPDLLTLDFEGILKYFRVALPKKYRTEEAGRELLGRASDVKIKKLGSYAKEYVMMKEDERLREDPVARLTRENQQLANNNMRLEQENDSLAHELVNKTITLRSELDAAEDRAELLTKELFAVRGTLAEVDEQRKLLQVEVRGLKEMCRRELSRMDTELQRNIKITADYKKICSSLSGRLEREERTGRAMIHKIRQQVLQCSTGECSALIPADLRDKPLRSENVMEQIRAHLLESSDDDDDDDDDNQNGDDGKEENEAQDQNEKENENDADAILESYKNQQQMNGLSGDGSEAGTPDSESLPSTSALGGGGGGRHKSSPSHVRRRHGLERTVRELELELAQTKLALVEAECISQDLVHRLSLQEETSSGGGSGGGSIASNNSNNTLNMLKKTFSTYKEAAKQKLREANREYYTTGILAESNPSKHSSQIPNQQQQQHDPKLHDSQQASVSSTPTGSGGIERNPFLMSETSKSVIRPEMAGTASSRAPMSADGHQSRTATNKHFTTSTNQNPNV